MKKFFLTLAAVLFAFLISQKGVKAAAPFSATAYSQTEVSYELPYPGVLPDSPWYFFKVARDSLTLLFVRKQPERSFYQIFLADKRIAAAEKLRAKGKLPLAAVTAMKAEELLREATGMGNSVKKNSDLISKLVVAQTKHGQILEAISAKYSSRETAKAWEDNEYVHNRIMNGVLLKK